MKLYVADTHALFWYFIASPLLGAQAQAAFDEGKQGQALIYIPAIVLAELYFLTEKKQCPIGLFGDLCSLDPKRAIRSAPVRAD